MKPDNKSRALVEFVHRILIKRLIAITALIALGLGALAFYSAYASLSRLVLEAAHNRITFLLYEAEQISRVEGRPPREAFLEALTRTREARFRSSHGSFVYARFYDRERRGLAEFHDDKHKLQDEVTRHVHAEPPRFPETTAYWNEIFWLGLDPHIHFATRVTDKEGETIGYVNAVFALSEAARGEIRGSLLATALAVVAVALVISLLLYPVILRLMRRLAQYSTGLLDANLATLQILGSAIAKRDSDTDAHNYRVTLYSVRLAEAVGLEHEQIQRLIKGAFLHDVGKIGIRDRILLKPGRLDKEEFEIMKTHVDHGLDIVSASPWLHDARDVVGGHHEKFDGSGYPRGLKAEAIPVTARIFAIADVFDALTSRRPYKEPFSFDDSMAILEKDRGSHFDPALVDAFAGIAGPLFERLGGREDDLPRKELKGVIDTYFTGGLETLHY